MCAVSSIQTLLRTFFPSSSAACVASTNIAVKRICIATLPNSIFATIAEQRSKCQTPERANQLLEMIEGKRLTYRRIGETANA